MSRRYARGKRAWGICGRCGGRALLNELVFDGHLPNMRVHQACWEPKHPQESLPRVADPIALWRPAPEQLHGPTAPVLTLEAGDAPSAELSWTEAKSGVSQIASYLIYRAIGDGEFELLSTASVTRDFMGAITSERTYSDEDVELEQSYYYRVVARPVQGPDSEPSNTVEFRIEANFIALESNGLVLLEGGGFIARDHASAPS